MILKSKAMIEQASNINLEEYQLDIRNKIKQKEKKK